MLTHPFPAAFLSAVAFLFCAPSGLAQEKPAPKAEEEEAITDDDPDLPVQDLRAKKDARKRYVVIGPRKGAKEPKDGWKSLFVLPGGGGGADFHPFVRNIARQAFADEYVVVQLVSVRWMADQPVIWPTEGVKLEEARFTTEEFFRDVHAEVSKQRKLDPRCCYTLSWSSGGPAAYRLALMDKTPVTGSYVAMSVFKPDTLPPLSKAKDKAFFLDHSPEDAICKYADAERAKESLMKAKAHVELVTYEGGHGWKGAIFDRMKAGRAFLEKHSKKPN